MTDALEARFKRIIREDPLARGAIDAAHASSLPDAWVVSGVLYNAVWNGLTGRPSGHGVRDVDVAYFDASDLSYAAEDAAIRAAAPHFAALGAPVEIRNQARVHLWFPERFGQPYPALKSVQDGVDRYASIAHAVAARTTAEAALEVYAPFGLEDVFAMRLRPNRVLDNAETHHRKGARAQALWPEVTVEPW